MLTSDFTVTPRSYCLGMGKRCKRCGEVKPLDAYYRHDGCRDGVRPECKACNLAEKARRSAANPQPARDRARRWREDPANLERTKAKHARDREDGRKQISDRRSYLKRKYGITLEEYDEKLAEQGGVCAVCSREPRPDISLHVDHDHETGQIRGLLCFRCNVAIGLISEDHDNLTSIQTYLLRHDPEWRASRDVVLARVRDLPPPAWKQSA